jgi:hypothetical protein
MKQNAAIASFVSHLIEAAYPDANRDGTATLTGPLPTSPVNHGHRLDLDHEIRSR